MIRRMAHALCWLAAGAVLAPSTAQAQRPNPIEVDGPYVHPATGMIFPVAAGPFHRTGMFDYRGDQSDVSGGYSTAALPNPTIATIYIYPALPVGPTDKPAEARKRNCQQEYDGAKANIAMHPGAKLIEEGAAASPSVHHPQPGKRAVYTLESLGDRPGPLRSELLLFCDAATRWHIKYRITGPAEGDNGPAVQELMRAVAWPEHFDEDTAALHAKPPTRLRLASAPNP
jgi:hypothetical protein